MCECKKDIKCKKDVVETKAIECCSKIKTYCEAVKIRNMMMNEIARLKENNENGSNQDIINDYVKLFYDHECLRLKILEKMAI